MVGIGTKLQGVNLMAHNSTEIIILFFVSRCRQRRKALSDLSILTKHLRIHSGEKPYQRKLCHLRFSQSGNLNRRMRTHELQQQHQQIHHRIWWDLQFLFGWHFYTSKYVRAFWQKKTVKPHNGITSIGISTRINYNRTKKYIIKSSQKIWKVSIILLKFV